MLNKKEIEAIIKGRVKYFFGDEGEIIVAVNQSEHGFKIPDVVNALNTLKIEVEKDYCTELWRTKSKDGKWYIFTQVVTETYFC